MCSSNSYSPTAVTSRELARILERSERSPPVLLMGIVTVPTFSKTVMLKMVIRGTIIIQKHNNACDQHNSL